MHVIFHEAFASQGIGALRLIVGHRSSPSLQRGLVRKRSPIHSLDLSDEQIKTKLNWNNSNKSEKPSTSTSIVEGIVLLMVVVAHVKC